MRFFTFGKTDFTYGMVLESRELLQVQCRKFAVLRIAEIQAEVPVVACFRMAIFLNDRIQGAWRSLDNFLDLLALRRAVVQASSHYGRIRPGVGDIGLETEKLLFGLDIGLVEEGVSHLHLGNVFHVLSLFLK